MRNGDPGYPDEPASFDFDSITVAGNDFMDFIDYIDSVDMPLLAMIEDAVLEEIEAQD